MRFDELAGQRQAKPESSLAADPFFNYPIEPIEHTWKVLLGNEVQ